jgi:hypothetical protein
MVALTILRELLNSATPQMHALRCEAVVAMVSSALDGASLAVTSLGRGIEGEAYEKHRIKRADRLMSNGHLSGERMALYTSLARRVTCGTSRPLISVDWSDLDEGKTRYLLRASVAVEGRALTVYEEVHPRERFMKAAVERQFLDRLAEVLGPTSRPIIVTDAGFHNPWLRAVSALGWDFVCRIRGRVMVGDANEDNWEQARSLFVHGGKQPKRLAKSRLSRDKPFECQFVIIKQGRRGRHHVNRSGRQARGHYSREQARSHREPWLLATSIDLSSSGALKRVVRAYKTRMQIEEAFRDLKSERFGLGFEASRATQIRRIESLLLIAMLALIVAWLVGYCVEVAGFARRYQANTVTKRKVLSTVYLGRRAWRESSYPYNSAQLHRALDAITEVITNQANGF